MADFNTALKALADGRLELSVMSRHLEKLLKQSPRNTGMMLLQLDKAREKKLLDDESFIHIKRQINEFRRTHAASTETTDDSYADATEFSRTGIVAELDLPEPATATPDDDDNPSEYSLHQNSESISYATKTEHTSPPSLSRATGPSSTGWQEPKRAENTPNRELGVGDVIKERFKLLDVLGIGGMGKVFKGIDLLKEEARDKNPYVAIKLLNEDFKSHPEAFISLQRESSRQQKLAHPNIATVYDFDRIGGPGTPVFITMELMEGQPLNTYIKRVARKQGGLPFPEAFKIISQLGSALEYAHNQRLVHSDFKPGNAFLCNDGTVKTLDFGIARAVKNPVTGETEKTLFDPGKLGALTPAYASLEMLEGEEPDTRDDTYALGCVAYELLSGKHPFNKLPATTAKDNGLIPAPIKGLNKKQNRALRRALAFRRENRSPSVSHFIEELEGKATWYKNPVAIAAEIILVLALIMIAPTMNYLDGKRITTIIDEINSGDRQTIMARLNEIQSFDKSEQATVIDTAKDAIQNYFNSEIAAYIDTSNENYDFPAAFRLLKTISAYYPDSIFMQKQIDDYQLFKNQKIADLYQQYVTATDPEIISKNPEVIDRAKAILDLIRTRIDPAHPLLSDTRPANAYRLAAAQAYTSGDFKEALKFINSGLQINSKDARLSDLKDKVARSIRTLELEQELDGIRNELLVLKDYLPIQKGIIELSRLISIEQSPVLRDLYPRLKSAAQQEIRSIERNGSRRDAETFVHNYAEMLSSMQMGQELTEARLLHLDGEARKREIEMIVADNTGNIEQKLASPELESINWRSSLLASLGELESLQEVDRSIVKLLQDYHRKIAGLYVSSSFELLKSNRFDTAGALLDQAEILSPGQPLLKQARTELSQTKSTLEKQERIRDLKEQFEFQTSADRVTDARNLYNQLKKELSTDDIYISTKAPDILANSYARLAQRRGDNGEFSSALELAEAGLDLAPASAILKALRDNYRVEVNIVELSRLFRESTSFDPIDAARRVNQIEVAAPARYPEFRKQAETILADRINRLAKNNESAAAALATAASTIFPVSSILADLKDRYLLEPWPDKNPALAALNAGRLTQANRLLQSATGDYTGHPDVIEFRSVLESRSREAASAYEIYLTAYQAAGNSYQQLRQAKKLLGRAQVLWIDNPDYDQAEVELDRLIAGAPDNPGNKILSREAPADFTEATQQHSLQGNDIWKPLASPRECTSRLAGYGRRAKAICFDYINTGWRGPLMVVIPKGREFDYSFAIGKYEISVGDYAKYCALSGKCKPESDAEKFNNPVTGITLAEAKDYARWLSERTGKTYRLPTKTEWEYAANAEGDQPGKDVNCTVTNAQGDKKLKGNGTVSVKSGQSNGWGLKNYVGNVQEWVISGEGAMAVGGAYNDLNSKCDISLQKPHAGSADSVTGFRIILEEVG